MSNQNVLVGIKFTADVTQAKQQMNELQNSLKNVMNLNTASTGKGMTRVLVQDLKAGQQAAAQLQVALRAAFNEKTGQLDLSRFNQSMQQSGMSLQKYKAQLTALGPTGQQAFTKLAQSVATAEAPTMRLSENMKRLVNTFANTARYQLSSSIIMGLTNGVRQAFTYAKDLNEALNDIRIVTGYGVDEMKDFAVEANKAAKALSTTTTEYAKASLIFYQQGLTGEAVKERADVVVKLANVTGQSAQTVSDQMTAIWNNFDNGSKSMEYYADVITKLGAATASSTDEISDGLEKFAAVSETVGLSYEMATAALATVTAETRQSADVVGTAFKTIFSRMEGLKLGDTLDDGTTLNQYSSALATAGVNIKDQNGQLKEMDTILTELGAKWGTLNKDQQIALAQSVAGVRQYNQFIALMGNWDKVQQNLDTAINSTGELNAQSEIYEESWGAATKRIKAGLEDIYSSLIDDEFIIKIMGFIEKFVNALDNIIDTMGGFKGVILLLGSALTKLFSTQIASSLTALSHSLMGLTKKGQERYAALKQEASDQLGTMFSSQSGSDIGKMQGQAAQLQAKNSNVLIQAQKELGAEAQAVLKVLQGQADTLAQSAINAGDVAAKQKDIAKKTHVKPSDKNQPYGEMSKTEGHRVTVGEIQEKGKASSLKRISERAVANNYISKDAINEFKASAAPDANDDHIMRELTMSKKGMNKTIVGMEKDLKASTAQSAAMAATQENYVVQPNLAEEGIFSAPNNDKIISLTEQVTTFRQTLDEAGNATEMFGKDGAKAFQDYSDGMAKMGAAAKDLKRVEDAQAKLAKAQKDYGEGSKQAKKASQELAKAQVKAEGAADRLKEGQDQAADGAKRFAEEQGKASQTSQELQEDFQTLGIDTEKVVESSSEMGKGMADVADKTTQAKISSDNLNKGYGNLKASTQGVATQITTVASTMMTVGMALSSLKGLISTLNNEDMSFGEKLISVMTTLGMVIPMVTMALNANNMAKMLGITLTKGMTNATIAETIATEGSALAKGILAAITKVVAAVKGVETTAVWANNTAWYASPLLWIPLVIVAVIAAIVGLIAIIKNLTASFSHAAKDKAMQENIKALGEEADKTRESVENLKSAWSGWNDAYNTLNGLTKGTAEWNAALLEANQKALELLEIYPQLADYMSTDANGAITFNKEVDGKTASQVIAETARDQTIRAQATTNLAGTLDRNRQIANTEYNIKKEFGQTAGDTWADIGNVAGATVAGSVLPLGPFGAMIGALTSLYQVGKGNQAEDAIYEKLIENDKKNQNLKAGEKAESVGSYEDFLNTFSEELSGTTEQFKQSMYEQTKRAEDQLERNRLAMIQNNQLLIANNKVIASSLLAADEEYINMSDDRRQATENVAAAYMARQEAQIAKNLADATDYDAGTADEMTYDEFVKISGITDDEIADYGISKSDFSQNGLVGNALFNDTATKQGKYIADQYIEIMKNSGQWQSGQAVEFHEEGEEGEIAKMTYTLADGTVETKEMNMSQMLSIVSANALSNSYEDLVKDAKEKVSALTNAQTIAMQENGVAGMTKEEFNEIFTQTGSTEYGKTFRINIPEEDLETMAIANGYFNEDGQANIGKYKEHLLNMAQGWDEVTAKQVRYNKVLEQTNAKLETAAQETGFSAKTLKAFAKQIEKNANAYDIAVKGEVENNAELRKSATSLAIAYAKLQKGLSTVSEAMDNNAEVIKNWKKDAKDSELPGLQVLESASAISDGLAEMFGVEVDPSLVIDNIDLIEQALAGVEGAGEQMANKVNEAYLESLQAGTNAQQELRALLAEDFESGTVNSSHFIEEANKMISQGKTTAEEVNKALSAIGYEAEIETAELHSQTRTAYPIYQSDSSGAYKPTGVEYLFTETTSTTQFLKPKNSKTIETEGSQTDSAGKVSTNTVNLSGGQGEETLNKKSDVDWDLATKDFASKKGNSKDDKDKKKQEDEIDRYYVVNEQLDRQNRALERLERNKKRASGASLVKLMQEESKALEDELKLLEKKDKEIDKALKEDYNAVDELNIGAKIENGIITNYDDIMKKALDDYNKAVETYNNSGKTQGDEDILDAAEKKYEKIKEALEQYQETYQEHLDSEQAMADKEIEIWEAQWDAFIEIQNQKIESWERMTKYFDIKSDYLDRKLEDLEDKEFSQAEQALALTEKMDNALTRAEENQKRYYEAEKIYNDAAKNGYVIDDNGNKIQLTDEKLQELEENMHNAAEAVADSTEEIQSIQDSIDGLIISFMEDQKEAFEEVGEELEHYGSRLSHYNDLLDLTGARVEDASKLRNQIAAAQTQNARAKLQTTQTELQLINEQIAEAERLGSDEETMKQLLARQRELQEGLEENLKASLEAVAEEYRIAIETAIQDAQKELLKNSPYKSLEEARQAFDQKQDLDNLYVDEYEKLYQISKLSRDINKSMSENTSLVANQKLSKLLDEINKKRESGVEMTEYELENLQRQYDLKLAEIALEEAQSAKSSMRLVRNSSGNWDYVYSADQEKIDQSMQQYEDALHAIEEAANNYLDELQANILDNQAEMYDAIAALRVEDYANYEEYEAAIQRIKDYYSQKNAYYYNQIDTTIKGLNLTYDESASKYGGYYATLDSTLTTSAGNHSTYQTTIEGIIDNITGKYDIQRLTFEELAISEVTGIKTIEAGVSEFNTNVSTLIDGALGYFQNYQIQQDGVLDQAGIDIKDFYQSASTDIGNIAEAISNVTDTTLPQLDDKASTTFKNMTQYIDDFNETYPDKVKAVVTENEKIEKSYQKIIDKIIEIGQKQGTVKNASNPTNNDKGGNDSTSGANGTTGSGKTNGSGTTNGGKTNGGGTTTKTDTSPKVEQPKTYQVQAVQIGSYQGGKNQTYYKVNGQWYTLSQLNAPEQGHTGKNDVVSIKDGQKGVSGISKFQKGQTVYYHDDVGNWGVQDFKPKSTSGATTEFTKGSGYVFFGDAQKQVLKIEDIKYSPSEKRYYYKTKGGAYNDNEVIWLRESQLAASMDTGGYTGEWGPEGKMAVLHEKELVLNKDQTSDFLNSLEFMAHIIDVIDRNTTLATAGLAIGKTGTAAAAGEKVVQQTVSIDATFPGVTSAIEIEEALNSLINDAVQYTNRDGWEG